MTHKTEKSGLALFTVTVEMLDGLDLIAKMFKQAGDNANYDFLNQIKTGLSKYPVAAQHINEMARLHRSLVKAHQEAADYEEQLFPVVKATDKAE
jgi:hypothetical protein